MPSKHLNLTFSCLASDQAQHQAPGSLVPMLIFQSATTFLKLSQLLRKVTAVPYGPVLKKIQNAIIFLNFVDHQKT